MVDKNKTIRTLLVNAWRSGVEAVSGRRLVGAHLTANMVDVSHVLSVGKAAGAMMLGVLDNASMNIEQGLVITKYAHTEKALQAYNNVQTLEAAHPIPDQNSLLAGESAIGFVCGLRPNAHLLMLVSGGASALVEKLDQPISLSQWQTFNRRWLSQGKTFDQINRLISQYSQ